MNQKYWFVFDVESVGLHGEAFAVGIVVIDTETGREIRSELFSCNPIFSRGTKTDFEWVEKNIPFKEEGQWGYHLCSGTRDVRDRFWDFWLSFHATSVMVADCPWPVESRFLIQCIEDDLRRSEYAPYPIIDVASVICANGGNPLTHFPRRESETPIHNPLADARQSARLLLEVLQK